MVVQERGLPFDVKIHEYPAISEEEAKAKVKKSIENITPESGIASKKFFDNLLSERKQPTREKRLDIIFDQFCYRDNT